MKVGSFSKTLQELSRALNVRGQVVATAQPQMTILIAKFTVVSDMLFTSGRAY